MRTFVAMAALAVCTATLAGPLDLTHAAASLSTEDTDVATTTPIKHLVVVFQENASFDHYFGTYPVAANSKDDPPFVAREHTPPVNNLLPSDLNGNRNLLVTNPNQAKPFRLDRSQFVTCSQDHGYRPEQRAANGGLMNRFVQATDRSGCADLPRTVPSPQVMGYFDGNTVTALWNYAQHFALNDHAFATNYGPSTPGALNLVAGRTSGASPDNAQNVTNGVVYGDPDPMYDDCADAATRVRLSGPNVGDLLSAADVSWGWFQGGFARTNPLAEPIAVCDATHPNLAGFVDSDYEAHHDPFQYFASTANPHHLPPTSAAAIGHDDQANHQYDLEDFWTAARAGHLPAVSFLKAPGFQDGHPGPKNSNPLDEQAFLVSTLNRLQQLPQWSSTAAVLAWDDSDGQYDHEPPPNVHHSGNPTFDALYGTTADTLCLARPRDLPPDPTTIFEMRCGYGERVPLLVVSPYAWDNQVDHTIVDQSSITKFIEDNWGLGRLGNGSFDEEAGSLLDMFDFSNQRDDTLILNPRLGTVDNAPAVHVSRNSGSVAYSDRFTPIEVTTSDADGDEVSVDAVGLPDGLTMSQVEDGSWAIGGTDQAPAGVYDASVRVSDGALTTEEPLHITVQPERATVGYTGDLLFSTGSESATTADVVLRAHVSQEADDMPGDLTKAGVVFDMYRPGNTTRTPDTTYSATPNADGDASVDAGSIQTGTWTVVVRTEPFGGFFEAPASDVVPITVYAPTTGSFVTAGGWVHDPGYLDRPVPISADDQGTFGLEARLRKDGTPSGQTAYVFSGADGNQYVMRSTGWQGGGLVITGDRATMAGTCVVTVLDPDGQIVSMSTDNTFRLDVSDASSSGSFALSVFTSQGMLYHRAGTPAEPLGLGGGQVVVHR